MRRIVSILALLALVGGVAAIGVAPPAAAQADSSRPQEYLALGDSIAFGYSPLVDPTNPDHFVAYPDIVAAALRDHVTNAACPGETSTHFVDLDGTDYGCGPWRANLPLHAGYTSTQLDFVDTFLQEHPKTRLVTIDIGVNDAQALVSQCGGLSEVACIQAGLQPTLARLSANLDTIYGHIRNVDGYRHRMVAVTIYSPDYGDQLVTGVIAMFDQVLAERTAAWGGIVADGFGGFAAIAASHDGDSCAAGLLIPVSSSPLTCDAHPSAAGRDVLANAIVDALRAD